MGGSYDLLTLIQLAYIVLSAFDALRIEIGLTVTSLRMT